MCSQQIMDLTIACQSFPELPEANISRDNIITTISTIFEGRTQMVVVEGEEGMGKTILLAQFAKRFPDCCFSVFLRPTSRWAYDPETVRIDLGNQLNWALYQQELSDDARVDDAFLRRAFNLLQKNARRRRLQYIFILDGLSEIPRTQTSVLTDILDLLPFGSNWCRFVLSGESKQLALDLPKGLEAKPFTLPTFNFDETVKYFTDCQAHIDFLEEIYKTSKGVPGHLASVRRLLQSGVAEDTILEELHTKLPQLFELEWAAVDKRNEVLCLALAILAHDRRSHSIDELARLLDVANGEVETMFTKLQFIEIDEAKSSVSYVSESFRRFAADRLHGLAQRVSDLLIDYLLRAPASDEALTYLPGYLEQAGKRTELLSYLSPERLVQMLERSQSRALVRQKADLGVETSQWLGRDPDLYRFSLQESIISGFDAGGARRSEIQALLALGDQDAALSLAQTANPRETQLYLLALVARRQAQTNGTAEAELVERIRLVYRQVDPRAMGDQAPEVAEALLPTVPDLAIDLVEKATDTDDLDFALAHLSAAAVDSRKGEVSDHSASDQIRVRIKDPKARRHEAEMSLVFGGYSAQQVISEVEAKIHNVSDQVYLLRTWTAHNYRRHDAGSVVEYALNLSIRTTAYSPTARGLRELASPLPYLEDLDLTRVKSLDVV
jgi:hypothetical protein